MSHDDHFHYGCFGRPSRRSPNVAGNNNTNNTSARRGFFSSGGRTVLPPLHLPFRTSRSPAPDPNFVTNQFGQQDPTQSRGDYNLSLYDQPGWPTNTPVHHSSAANQFPNDPRYSSVNPSYPSSASRAPPLSYDSRDMPVTATHQGQYYQHTGDTTPSMMSSAHIRSPSTGGYPTQYTYGAQTQQASYYPGADPRALTSGMAGMTYDSQGASIPRRASLSVDRTVPSRLSQHNLPPYARPMVPSPYDQEPVSEPVIKKKRKRADAEQLKVLNETYNRTAFPSTEERNELAKKLGMSARSVQIWFQNKRQAMRQSTRQASNAAAPVAAEPFTAGPAPNSAMSTSPPPVQGGAYSLQPGGPMGSISMAGQIHGGQRVEGYRAPVSSSPPSQYRSRAYDERDRRTPQRSPSRTR